MNECNCGCCCAYLNPPWWVTMGYAPGFQPQRPPPSQITPAPSGTSAQTAASQDTFVLSPRLGGAQATLSSRSMMSQTGSGAAKAPITPAKVATDVATGNIVGVLQDVVQLL